ncbi:MAG: zinc ribbon domain-containing protein [Anaerolineales bacterium]|nr:zinc ribbon domain-containing protein [Anaerolineales bacterium]
MPLFEYQCQDCKRSFEELVLGSTARVEIVCPICKSTNVQKKISTFASISSGTGGFSTGPAASCAPGGT